MSLAVDPSLLTSLDPAPATLTLRMDALFFRSAVSSLRSLDDSKPAIDAAVERVQSLLRRQRSILDGVGGDERAAYDTLEPIYSELEDADHTLAEAYSPYIREITSIYFNAHSAVEAFVNWLAYDIIEGSQRDEFDRLSLFRRCTSLPCLRGLRPFDPGREPLQSVKKLIRSRNNLMHYKPRMEPWNGVSIPSFLDALGLSREDAEKAISAARMYIEKTCKTMSVETPGWLHFQPHGHFDVVFGFPESN
jgi:hypothetical protein